MPRRTISARSQATLKSGAVLFRKTCPKLVVSISTKFTCDLAGAPPMNGAYPTAQIKRQEKSDMIYFFLYIENQYLYKRFSMTIVKRGKIEFTIGPGGDFTDKDIECLKLQVARQRIFKPSLPDKIGNDHLAALVTVMRVFPGASVEDWSLPKRPRKPTFRNTIKKAKKQKPRQGRLL